MTSGAIQGKVPTTVMWVVWDRNLDAPKSQIWDPESSEENTILHEALNWNINANMQLTEQHNTHLQGPVCCHHHWNKENRETGQSCATWNSIILQQTDSWQSKWEKEEQSLNMCYRSVTWGLCEWLWLELQRGGNGSLWGYQALINGKKRCFGVVSF